MRGKEFAALVHEILTGPDNGWTIDKVAGLMGLSYDTLYSRLGGNMRVTFSAEEIRLLIRHVPEPRLLYYLLDGTDFIAIARSTAGEENGKNLVQKMMVAVSEVGDIAHQMDIALSDKKIDHKDRARLRAEVYQAEQALASLRASLETA